MEEKVMLDKVRADLSKLEQLEKITSHALADYESEPENLSYEATFDAAYKSEWEQLSKCVASISAFAKVDEYTVRILVVGKRDELQKILNR